MNQNFFITHLVTDVGLPMAIASTLMDILIASYVITTMLEENQTTIIIELPDL